VEGHSKVVPMPKKQDYIEWEGKDAEPVLRVVDDCARMESLFDREIRRRVGELIARAMMSARRREQ
jgi:hypothetical protein